MLRTNTTTFTPDFGGEPAQTPLTARPFAPGDVDAEGWSPAIPCPTPLLLEGVIGASASTVQAVEAVQALTLDRFEKGYAHTCAEMAKSADEDERDAVFQEAISRGEEAVFALLDDGVVDPRDRQARVTAFLRSRAFFTMPARSWRQLSAAEAAEYLDEEELVPAIQYMLGTASPPSSEAQAEGGLAEILEKSDQLTNRSCGLSDATQAEEIAELDARADALHERFIDAPISSKSDALIKLRWLKRGIIAGETGRELEVIAQLVRFLGGDPAEVLADRWCDEKGWTPPAPPAPQGRREWDEAVAAVQAEYERIPTDSDALGAAIDRLLGIDPPDLAGVRFLFDVVMTETQALGVRAAEARDFGDHPLTDHLLAETCGWPKHQPCVFIEPGNGLSAGLIHVRRALDRLVGDHNDSWNVYPDEPASLIAAE